MSCDCHKPSGHHEHFCAGDTITTYQKVTKVEPPPFEVPPERLKEAERRLMESLKALGDAFAKFTWRKKDDF